jgi:citrate lyase subunit beta/citryl-CoA lyase
MRARRHRRPARRRRNLKKIGMTIVSSMTPRIERARTFLFVPGNRPERFEKALRSGADAVVLDLEDAVPSADKTAARNAIVAAWPALCAMNVPLVVRINPLDSEAGAPDLAWLATLQQPPAAVMLPKADGAEAVERLHRASGCVPVLPLIESVAGHDALDAIAGAAGCLRLVLGHIDFMADSGLQCDDDDSEIAPLRFAIAMATRRHRLAPAVDGVTVQTGDVQRLQRDTRRALRFGFGAKLCIHPAQVAGVHEAFAPSADELAWARRVVEADAAAGGAAVQLDGRMVDLPVVLQARRTLARAAGAG